MNKTTKGALAAATAAALLIGGAGTLAFWSDSDSVDAGTITAGKLSLTPVAAAATWTDTHDSSTISDIASFRVVPGDKLVYEAGFTVNADGDNLEAALDVDDASVSGALLDESSVNVAVTDSGGSAIDAITPAQDGETITARVTFDFPYAAATNDSQQQAVDLSGLRLTLTQQPVS